MARDNVRWGYLRIAGECGICQDFLDTELLVRL
jgi:hypothetical protein